MYIKRFEIVARVRRISLMCVWNNDFLMYVCEVWWLGFFYHPLLFWYEHAFIVGSKKGLLDKNQKKLVLNIDGIGKGTEESKLFVPYVCVLQYFGNPCCFTMLLYSELCFVMNLNYYYYEIRACFFSLHFASLFFFNFISH